MAQYRIFWMRFKRPWRDPHDDYAPCWKFDWNGWIVQAETPEEAAKQLGYPIKSRYDYCPDPYDPNARNETVWQKQETLEVGDAGLVLKPVQEVD